MAMKVFRISGRNLRLLDHEFAGAIGNALAEVTRSRCDPELKVERLRLSPNRPSTWTIVVEGDGIERRFDTDHSAVATAIAAHIYARDFADELRNDLAGRVQEQDMLSDDLSWPHQHRGDPS